jgi:hypothetical protein
MAKLPDQSVCQLAEVTRISAAYPAPGFKKTHAESCASTDDTISMSIITLAKPKQITFEKCFL